MKAVIAHEYGPVERLAYGDWPDPVPATREIVVEQEAIGMNFPDGLLVKGLYQSKPPVPFVPGMEVVGTVAAVGSGVTRFKTGDRVAAISMLNGYAEEVVVDERQAFALPNDMPAADAAAMLTGYGTSHYALKQRAHLQTDETLCVTGASGLTGSAAVQIGKALGARVIAVASTQEKQKIAIEAGADEAIGYDDLSARLKSLTNGKGVDVAFDTVGGDAFDVLSRRMAWNGRLLVIGFTSGDIPKLPVNLALLKNYSLVGVFWGEFIRREAAEYAANMNELFAWYAAGKVTPVIGGNHPLADAGRVLQKIMARGVSGKHVLIP